MILTGLFIMLVLALLLQPNGTRLFAGAVFIGVTLTHELLLADQTGFGYYGSAALFDLGIALVLAWVPTPPRMVVRLQQICIASILANLGGWTLWLFYWPPMLYDMTFVIIYLWALVVLLQKDTGDVVGRHAVVSWGSRFLCHTRARVRVITSSRGKI